MMAYRRAAASCRFDRNQLVFHIVQLYETRTLSIVIKVQRHGLEDVSAELVPRLRFRKIECPRPRAQ